MIVASKNRRRRYRETSANWLPYFLIDALITGSSALQREMRKRRSSCCIASRDKKKLLFFNMHNRFYKVT